MGKKEFQNFVHTLQNPKKIFTKEDLYETVWAAPYLSGDNTLNAQLSNLLKETSPSGCEYGVYRNDLGLRCDLKEMTDGWTAYCIDWTSLGVTTYLVRYYFAVKSLKAD